MKKKALFYCEMLAAKRLKSLEAAFDGRRPECVASLRRADSPRRGQRGAILAAYI